MVKHEFCVVAKAWLKFMFFGMSHCIFISLRWMKNLQLIHKMQIVGGVSAGNGLKKDCHAYRNEQSRIVLLLQQLENNMGQLHVHIFNDCMFIT
mmetsp:Transcript_20008/g.26416  ORF Transcript_20008/g.26416 Transcript_20008/m.26416 type:complete len:94 (-) Transcript_20008:135-416(-)